MGAVAGAVAEVSVYSAVSVVVRLLMRFFGQDHTSLAAVHLRLELIFQGIGVVILGVTKRALGSRIIGLLLLYRGCCPSACTFGTVFVNVCR